MKFFQFELQFNAFCQDRSPSIANAVHSIWPDCKVVLCWPHIICGAIDRGKLKNKDLVELFNSHLITYVHSARTSSQFEILLELMLKHWVDIGEKKMAESFEKVVYGTNPWTNWHVTAQDLHLTIMSQRHGIDLSKDTSRQQKQLVLASICSKICQG